MGRSLPDKNPPRKLKPSLCRSNQPADFGSPTIIDEFGAGPFELLDLVRDSPAFVRRSAPPEIVGKLLYDAIALLKQTPHLVPFGLVFLGHRAPDLHPAFENRRGPMTADDLNGRMKAADATKQDLVVLQPSRGSVGLLCLAESRSV